MNEQPEVNLCDEESRLLMFQALAARLEVASQDESQTLSLLARAGCTPEETRWMAAL